MMRYRFVMATFWRTRPQRVVAVLLLGVLTGRLQADDKPPPSGDPTKREAEITAQWAAGEFTRLQLQISAPRDHTLQPVKKSLLRWSNPGAGRVYGEVFAWTRSGRPEAVVSLFQWFSPWDSRNYEFRSLSVEKVSATLDGAMIWSSQSPGVEWKPLRDTGEPASTAPERLTQMRAIARRFRGVLTDRRTDEQGVKRELRLLSQPLLRYEAPAAPITDGVLFAFVTGTDPELFLLVESHAIEGRRNWQYALARMNRDAIDVKLDETVVWRVEYLPGEVYCDKTQPYFLTWRTDSQTP